MKQKILIKYGELNTKKANIGLFLKTLKNNIAECLKDYQVNIVYDKGRMYVEYNKEDENEVLAKLKKVFGIQKLALCYELDSNNLLEIKQQILSLLLNKSFQTFKINTTRSDKTYPLTSLEISKQIGSYILKHKENVKVDVHDPNLIIYVEIRKTSTYIYFENIFGLGGYPVSSLGKGLLMLSGGLDSPVSGYLAMKRGVKIEAIYFDSPPHTSIEAKNKVITLSKIIGEYQNGLKIHVIPFTKIQEMIYKEVPNEYLITIMRRMMYRISEKIAKKNKCKIIINGESIGQVASQTLESISVINECIKMPVIRPVACFDKLEIISLAKKINTYETSILPYMDCCTIFVPKHPVIYPTLSNCLLYEQRLDYESLIDEAIKNEEIIKNKKALELEEYL